jgi:hypothetical protein
VRRLFLAALIGTLSVAGCIRPRPNTAPQVVSPLEVPPPPPRVIAPPESEEPTEETAPTEPAPAKDKPNTRRPQRPGVRVDTAKPVEPKTEAPPVEVAKPPATPPPAPLQPALQASQEQTKKQVEAQLAQAQKDIQRVDTRTLSADAKTQYEAAKQFIEQAGTALKEGNLVFAQKLAEKAAGLASNLVPR